LNVRTPVISSRFKRDVKRMERRNKDIGKLREALLQLIDGLPLPARYQDHPLTGDWKNFRDCHIEPDWILIYKIDGNDLHLVATGTHADLF
jgi:mRNA interferase YafQ